MSRTTTTPLQWAPAAADGLLVSTGSGAWANGDWVPFITATTADDTAMAGISIHDTVGNPWSNAQIEAEFGVGPEDSEVPIGHIRLSAPNSGNGGPTSYLIEFPISGIGPGVRVSLRLREADGGASTWRVTVAYYEDLDSDQVIPYTVATLTSFPAGADSIQITPSATPWASSAWEEFSPAVGEPTYIIGVAPSASPTAIDWEIDIGTGVQWSEATRTSVRGGTFGNGRINNVNLPGLLPITTGERLVGSVRKGGTSTATMHVAFLAYTGSLVAAAEGGTIGPLLWLTISFRPPVV